MNVTVTGCNFVLANILTVVTGNLLVQGNNGCVSIFFSMLTAVQGDLIIENNSDTQFTFPLLKSVGGRIIINDNVKLSVVNFPELTSVGGNVEISDNEESFFALFSKLESIPANLIISGNTLTGSFTFDILFEELQTVLGDLEITENTTNDDGLIEIRLIKLIELQKNCIVYKNTQNGISRIDLNFGFLETIKKDLKIMENIQNSTTQPLEFNFFSLQEVLGEVLIGAEDAASGNLITSNNVDFDITFPLLESIGADLLVGSRATDSVSNSKAGNQITGVTSNFNISLPLLKSVGKSVIVGKIANFTEPSSPALPGNSVSGQDSTFALTIGSDELVIEDSLCIGAFGGANGGNWGRAPSTSASVFSAFAVSLVLKTVKKDVKIGAFFDSIRGNGNFNIVPSTLENSIFSIDLSTENEWAVLGDLEIGAFSQGELDTNTERGNFASSESTMTISTGGLTSVAGSMRIGAFRKNAAFGNSTNSATLKILGNGPDHVDHPVPALTVGCNLLIGAFDGASFGNFAEGTNFGVYVLFPSITQIDGAVKIGAFGQIDSKHCRNAVVSTIGNAAAGESCSFILDLTGLEELNNFDGLAIGGAASNPNSRSVALRGNFAGGFDGRGSLGNNVHQIDLSSLKRITACHGLRIGVFGPGLRDGNYAGQNSVFNIQQINLSHLLRVDGPVCTGAFGNRSSNGNATFGTRDNGQFIDLSSLKTINGSYKVVGNFKEAGDEQIWCYNAFSVQNVTGCLQLEDNKGIRFLRKGKALRSTDCPAAN